MNFIKTGEEWFRNCKEIIKGINQPKPESYLRAVLQISILSSTKLFPRIKVFLAFIYSNCRFPILANGSRHHIKTAGITFAIPSDDTKNATVPTMSAGVRGCNGISAIFCLRCLACYQ